MAPADAHRLPRTVRPRHYALRLAPDLETATFDGEVTIDVEVVLATDEVVLNASELTVTVAEVEAAGSAEPTPAATTLDEDLQRLTLHLPEPLPPGPARVRIHFSGVLNDKLRGFYRSTTTGPDGEEQVIATTQMEATDARRAFPCWDEPELKATFAVTLDVAEDLVAVSNAAEVSSEPLGDGRRRVRFAPTMVMSTYLVAFVVGPLEVTEPVDVDGVPLRVVHRPGQGALTAFALESGAFALRHFAEYFGRPYPGDKLDLVAVPDFAFGAMENLGCVIFRDALLLVDPERATQPELQRVADVIHHEIAHMWFGDLVTMGWWNGIWLNEAFATFMELHATDAFRPEWDRWTDFGIARTAAFDTDALSTTRPIEFEVVSPADAEAMFDVLTYEKGAAVVRMLEQYLGADRFRDGIRLYIERHAHGSTETTDLWDAIEDATGEPVRRIMDTWIYQGGHPEVALAVEDGPDGAALVLTQSRLRYAGGGDAPDARWSVPVLLRHGTSATAADTEASAASLDRVLLEGGEARLEVGPRPDWVLVNSGGSGFYRVRYATEDRTRLVASGQLDALERYGLVDDAWAGVLAGSVSVDEVVELIEALSAETDLSVWQRVIGVLGALDRVVLDVDRPALQRWTRGVLRPSLDRLGVVAGPEDGARTRALRAALLGAAGTLAADDAARSWARATFAAAEDGDPDGADAAVRVVAATGTADDFAELRARALAASTPQDRLRHQGALADLPGAAEIDAFCALTLTDEIRTQDAPFTLRRALANRTQGARAWGFVADHWDELVDRFPSGSIARMVEGIRTVTDRDLASTVAAHLAAHPVPQGAKPIAQHLERMWVNVALAERAAPALAARLADQDPLSP